MKFLHGKIGVEFDLSHNKKVAAGLNGLDIIRADRFYNNDNENQNKYNENVNYLETLPQICHVMHPSSQHSYDTGDKLFVHYMACDCAEETEFGTVIDTDFIFFRIIGEEFQPIDSLYIGEQVYTNEEVTSSGIFLGGPKRDGLKIKITHTPQNAQYKVGDIVLSIDDKNYEFDYWGKKYIKLMIDEIAGLVL